MMTGRVTAAREAVMPFEIERPGGGTVSVEAVIDNGFTGFLTLPAHVVAALGLPFVGTTQATLSDGQTVALDVFEATVRWDGRPRLVTVLAAAGGIMVGRAMLMGFRLTLDGAIGGIVRLEALP